MLFLSVFYTLFFWLPYIAQSPYMYILHDILCLYRIHGLHHYSWNCRQEAFTKAVLQLHSMILWVSHYLRLKTKRKEWASSWMMKTTDLQSAFSSHSMFYEQLGRYFRTVNQAGHSLFLNSLHGSDQNFLAMMNFVLSFSERDILRCVMLYTSLKGRQLKTHFCSLSSLRCK